MRQTNVYINGVLYLSGDASPGPRTTIRHSYFGSSTRKGPAGNVFTPEDGFNTVLLRVVEVSEEGADSTIFDGIIDVQGFCVSVAEKNLSDLDKFGFSEEDKVPIIAANQELVKQVKEGKACTLGSLSKMPLGGEREVIVFFRDLHRFGDCVEIAGVSYKAV
jgi:hypothetical protein